MGIARRNRVPRLGPQSCELQLLAGTCVESRLARLNYLRFSPIFAQTSFAVRIQWQKDGHIQMYYSKRC